MEEEDEEAVEAAIAADVLYTYLREHHRHQFILFDRLIST